MPVLAVFSFSSRAVQSGIANIFGRWHGKRVRAARRRPDLVQEAAAYDTLEYAHIHNLISDGTVEAKRMSEFFASMYQITRAGRHVTGGLFNTADELFERIRCERAGVYSVYRLIPLGEGPGGEAEFWGDVAHFGAGKISFDPAIVQT